MAVDASSAEFSQAKPTQAETVKAWHGQALDARDIRDKDIIQNTVEVTKPDQPQPESSKLQGVEISPDVMTGAFKGAREAGDKAMKYLDSEEAQKIIAATKAQEAGRLARARVKLASMIGRKK